VDILLEAAANKSRFERESENGFSIPLAKKRRIASTWHLNEGEKANQYFVQS